MRYRQVISRAMRTMGLHRVDIRVSRRHSRVIMMVMARAGRIIRMIRVSLGVVAGSGVVVVVAAIRLGR